MFPIKKMTHCFWGQNQSGPNTPQCVLKTQMALHKNFGPNTTQYVGYWETNVPHKKNDPVIRHRTAVLSGALITAAVWQQQHTTQPQSRDQHRTGFSTKDSAQLKTNFSRIWTTRFARLFYINHTEGYIYYLYPTYQRIIFVIWGFIFLTWWHFHRVSEASTILSF